MTDKLKTLQDRLREVESRREARASESAAALELKAAELALADAEARDAMEAEHGPLGQKIADYETPMGVIIVKRPDSLIFKRFVDGGKSGQDAALQLVRPCVVHPSKQTFDVITDELPGVVGPLANLVATLAGVRVRETEGK